MICELYVLSDSDLQMLIDNPDTAENILEDQYAFIHGKKHLSGETVFSMGKAWDIALYLLKANDGSPNRILDRILENKLGLPYSGYTHLFSPEVAEIHAVLENISGQDAKNAYSKEKMIQEQVCYADLFTDWEYIKTHVQEFKDAFAKAAAKKNAIVISIG